MFKPNCTYCHKKLQKNDSTIQFGKSNIWHENCYREHLEKNIQNIWLREIRLLKKVFPAKSRTMIYALTMLIGEIIFKGKKSSHVFKTDRGEGWNQKLNQQKRNSQHRIDAPTG